MQASNVSLLSPIGYQSSDCGYCKGDNDTSACYYATCRFLGADTYQKLVDRGWRRSGSLIYKPDVYRACCPHYTIRLPVASLTTSRDQRQTLNRWNKFVLGEDYLKEVAKTYPKTKEEKCRQKNGFDLLHTLHEAEVQNLKPAKPSHRFEVTLEPDTFSEEKYLLYKEYQIKVHHDRPSEVSQSGFKRFLCSSPLSRTTLHKEGKEQQLGSFHQCYRLDGRLIAIGVLDLLPHAVSGVYFIYHPDFERWSFGKLSAMREAALAREGGYEFYYMGYYIHNCVKMRYKGDYKPQYVLDPETYEWNPLDNELRGLLDQKKYVSLSRERNKKHGTLPVEASGADAQDAESLPTELETADLETADLEREYTLSSPKDAADAEMSLLSLGMPGIPKADELEKEIDLGNMQIFIKQGKGMIVHLSDLQSWEDGDILDSSSLKGIVAEFAACVGPTAAKDIILDFSR